MTAAGPGHEQWRESAAAYLLGALDETDDGGGFEAHMADCPACRDEIADLRGTVEALALAAPPMAPPPELAARIMRTVQQEADLLRAAGPEADRPLHTRDKRSPWARLTAWMPALSPALALPAALVVLALGALAGGELADGGSNPDGRQTVAGQVLDPNSAQDTHVELRLGRDEATLVAERLPQPPPGRVYQVWLKRPGTRPEPTNTLFAPRADGSAVAAVPGSLDGVEAVLVTDEPAGGSRRPSREPILLVNPTA